MTSFHVHREKKNFTMIDNSIVEDKRLSAKAKGLLLYAFSRPDDWQFTVEDFLANFSDKKASIDSGLKELEEVGYLIRQRLKAPDGKFFGTEWIFFEDPKTQNSIVA